MVTHRLNLIYEMRIKLRRKTMSSSASRALLERIRMNCYPDATCVKPKFQSSDTGGIATTH